MDAPSSDGGRIEVFLGPMTSGKSSLLQTAIRLHRIANRKCLLIKYAGDTRYSETMMSTHDKQMMEALSVEDLKSIEDTVFDGIQVIGIDEAQFFKGLVDFCQRHANAGRIVIASGLNGTFEQKAFGEMLDLIPIAEKIEKKSAICMVCFREASFTRRLIESTEVKLIGGNDKYEARCRKCWNDPIRLLNNNNNTIPCSTPPPAKDEVGFILTPPCAPIKVKSKKRQFFMNKEEEEEEDEEVIYNNNNNNNNKKSRFVLQKIGTPCTNEDDDDHLGPSK